MTGSLKLYMKQLKLEFVKLVRISCCSYVIIVDFIIIIVGIDVRLCDIGETVEEGGLRQTLKSICILYSYDIA